MYRSLATEEAELTEEVKSIVRALRKERMRSPKVDHGPRPHMNPF